MMRRQLTERAAAEAGRDLRDGSANGATVVVYYADESGRKVVHYFKKIS
jgi:hypothetical protein